jgi:naphthalene 1,2-dioxygenase system ferredoxin subunit
MDNTYTKATSVSDLPEGTMKTVLVGGKPLALSNVDGEFFAVDDICTHEHCSLGTEGFLDGSTITCGCHGAMYDTTSGKVLSLPATQDLRSYEVKVEGTDIFVKLG